MSARPKVKLKATVDEQRSALRAAIDSLSWFRDSVIPGAQYPSEDFRRERRDETTAHLDTLREMRDAI